VPRWKQQVGGLFMTVLGAGFTGWIWYTALFRGYFHRKASMIFPAVFVLGLGIIIFPGYREERIARGEDISRLQGWRLITPRWWVILITALSAGGANCLLLSSL
jgi:tellurite resistance protein TehA-like permease